MTRKALPVLWVCVRVQFLQTFLLLPIRFFCTHYRMDVCVYIFRRSKLIMALNFRVLMSFAVILMRSY